MKKPPILLISVLLLTICLSPARAGQAQSNPPTSEEIAAYLTSHPRLVETGAVVLSVRFNGEALVIDLSQAILPGGTYDEAIFTDLQDSLDQVFQINQRFLTTFKVEGKLLEDWGRPLPDFSQQIEPPATRSLPGSGPLAGVKIALSPGHGLYWWERYGIWSFQRADFWGIREDTVNAEIMRYVQAALTNQGATVIPVRELDPNARTGITGSPAWHEGARQYGIFLGLPAWVWNGSNNNYNSDIRSRPYMANLYGADILISLHNNGWNGELRGTETYWDVDNHQGSQALANAVHNSIVTTMRSTYGAWTDRHVKLSLDDYGEINYAQMPAALVELAFMDNAADNALLHQDTFKRLAANAITQGICDYWGVTCILDDPALPVVVETPTLSPPYGSGMCDSGWYRFTNTRGNDAYLTLNAQDQSQSTHAAAWQPALPTSGEYRVEVYIPDHNAIAWQCPTTTTQWDTGQARYTLTHANGTTDVYLNQTPFNSEWADLGIFHFDTNTIPSLQLTDLTQESFQTTTVSASAARFTLVGNAGMQFSDTAWIDADWFHTGADAPAEHIRNFFEFNRSCLQNPIHDADEVEIDLSNLIQSAAAANGINPRLLLALMEAEQQALSHCPGPLELASLMGLAPATTARQQIAEAAALFGTTSQALGTTGITPHGWETGTQTVTLDGVTVTPANDTITLLFDWAGNAGTVWGGSAPGVTGVHAVYLAIVDFNLQRPLPKDVYYRYLPIYIH